jgi:hypothetical protein
LKAVFYLTVVFEQNGSLQRHMFCGLYCYGENNIEMETMAYLGSDSLYFADHYYITDTTQSS